MENLLNLAATIFQSWTDMLISGAACVLSGFLGFMMGVWWHWVISENNWR